MFASTLPNTRFAKVFFVLSVFLILSNDVFPTWANEPASTKPEPITDQIDSLITSAIEGAETGLPIPRFVSLKGKRTNMRIGPSFDNRISWVYVKPGVPVEVIQEFEIWRHIRDADGQEGWVHKSMLSSRRTAIVAPWASGEYFPLMKEPDETARKAAKLQAGVYADIESCTEQWCRINTSNYSGWVQKKILWGVYEGEQVK